MDFPRHGFCVEPGCGDKFRRVSGNQRFCEKHSHHSKYLANVGKPGKCLMCEQPFSVQWGGQTYCGAQCRDASRNLRRKKSRLKNKKKLCFLMCECGNEFQKRIITQKRCDVCIIKEKTTPIGDNKIEQKHSGIPCGACKYSAPNKDATFGIECTINRWLICKPLSFGAKPYEALDSTA